MKLQKLKPYLVNYVNAYYEDVHNQLVFAYDHMQ